MVHTQNFYLKNTKNVKYRTFLMHLFYVIRLKNKTKNANLSWFHPLFITFHLGMIFHLRMIANSPEYLKI